MELPIFFQYIEVKKSTSLIQVKDLVLEVADSIGWYTTSFGLYYEYDLYDSNITATSVVQVIPDNEDTDIIKVAGVLPKTLVEEAGYVKIYSLLEPTDDIHVTINIWEKDGSVAETVGSFVLPMGGGETPLQITGLTLLSTGWTLVSGFYEYDLANANITATAEVEVIYMKETITITKAADIMPDNLSDTGTVKIYATNEPTGDISVSIIITEVIV